MQPAAIQQVSARAPPAGFWDLLALSVGCSSVEKLEHVRASYAAPDRGLADAFVHERLAGAIGYRRRDTEVEIMHVAVREDVRRHGIARALVSAVSRRHADLVPIAETDDEAVGFYRAIGFSTEALPRQDDRARRWRCRRIVQSCR